MTQYAKAIAAAVTPLVVWAITWLFDNAGIDITFDSDKVNQAIVVAITAIAVLWKRNASTEPPAE